MYDDGAGQEPQRMRLDKWLWAARFYKTRSLAVREIQAARVQVNRQTVKPAREVSPGDQVEIRRPGLTLTVEIRALSKVRGPASRAALLYSETPESRVAREQAAEQRRLAPEPARSLAAGRPTKRDRRKIDRWRGRQ